MKQIDHLSGMVDLFVLQEMNTRELPINNG
jgi:hypothetical protein